MSDFVVSTEYGRLVVEESNIPGIKHASVRCGGGCGKVIGIPPENRFTSKKQFEDFLRKHGWRKPHRKGWVCPSCDQEQKRKRGSYG